MSKAGRPPKPTAIKKLEGNPGKRPLPDDEPVFSTIIPQCPEWLSIEGKLLWKTLVPQLQAIPGLLQSVDVSALEVLCESYAQWKIASIVLQKDGQTFKTGNGYIQQRPEVAIANKCAKAVKDICSEFGITPSSRSRIHVKMPEGSDGFDEY
jgi:P27 family predicted phage terminase small subunit